MPPASSPIKVKLTSQKSSSAANSMVSAKRKTSFAPTKRSCTSIHASLDSSPQIRSIRSKSTTYRGNDEARMTNDEWEEAVRHSPFNSYSFTDPNVKPDTKY